MKDIKSRLVIIGGILVAFLTILNTFTFAGASDLENLDIEQYALIESMVNEMVETDIQETSSNNIYKVYNMENRLVYETRNIDDQKLQGLIRKSDLLTTVDHIIFYKMSH